MEPYIPDLGIAYPASPDEHITPLIKVRDLMVDQNYPFLDRTWRFRFMRGLMHLGIFTLVFRLSPLRFGLKIEGRERLRKHRRLLQDGAMTVSNHIHRWDFLFVLQALRFRLMYFPAWKENLMGRDGRIIRWAGGIPVPGTIHAMRGFNQAFDAIRAKKKWIHVFPESARWDYFYAIRPFKKGAFTLACRYNLPVLPLGFSYRKPRFPYTLVNLPRKKKLPMITLRIGEPLLPDSSLPRREAVMRLRKDCHEAVTRLAGIEHNPYPAEGD
ncbi:MAG: 1-acyl-sn-glycerol-3-phosphate acyltransferase [Treponema sp.]|jgi:1-acyl-sn-glycerol-3-phosphate acyltransferase|nr:1-acyl-sn-glycerol-3-phosphate acyltransferase [Treponema sp.]